MPISNCYLHLTFWGVIHFRLLAGAHARRTSHILIVPPFFEFKAIIEAPDNKVEEPCGGETRRLAGNRFG